MDPPALTEQATASLKAEAISWAAQHGMLMATEDAEAGAAMQASFTHVPIALLPTPFPRDVFELAARVTPLFSVLSDDVSRDDEFLRKNLEGVLRTDDFIARLWGIYEACGAQQGRHPMELGILRSDFMLDVPSGLPLQVEVNTVAASFMALSSRVSQLHRHLVPWAALQHHYGGGDGGEGVEESGEWSEDQGARELTSTGASLPSLPENAALDNAAATLAAGWRAMVGRCSLRPPGLTPG